MYVLAEITLSIIAIAVFLTLLKGSWLIVQDKEYQYQQRKFKGQQCQSVKPTSTKHNERN